MSESRVTTTQGYSQQLHFGPVEGGWQAAAQPRVVRDLKAAQVELAVGGQPGGREGRAREPVVLQAELAEGCLHSSRSMGCVDKSSVDRCMLRWRWRR